MLVFGSPSVDFKRHNIPGGGFLAVVDVEEDSQTTTSRTLNSCCSCSVNTWQLVACVRSAEHHEMKKKIVASCQFVPQQGINR